MKTRNFSVDSFSVWSRTRYFRKKLFRTVPAAFPAANRRAPATPPETLFSAAYPAENLFDAFSATVAHFSAAYPAANSIR